MKPLQESLSGRLKNSIKGKQNTIFDFVTPKKMLRGVCDWPMLVIKKYHDVVDDKILKALPDIIGPIKDNGLLKNELLSTREEIIQRLEEFVTNKLLNDCGKDVIKTRHDAVQYVIRMCQYNDPRIKGAHFTDGSFIGMYLEGGTIISIEFKHRI